MQRSSLKRELSLWRSGTGTWWARMTSWERFECHDFNNVPIFIRYFVCTTIKYAILDVRCCISCSKTQIFYFSTLLCILVCFLFSQVEIPFACLHKTPLLEGWFRLLPLGNNEVDTRWEVWVCLFAQCGAFECKKITEDKHFAFRTIYVVDLSTMHDALSLSAHKYVQVSDSICSLR